MANKDQLKALINSYFEDDSERFITVALQVAANAAKKGQNNLASDIKELIDKGREKRKSVSSQETLIPKKIKGELSGLFSLTHPRETLKDVVFSQDIDTFLYKLLKEQKQRFRLKDFGYEPISKLLLTGPPGTGKTLTASVIANELNIPLYTVQFEGLLSRFMGESASKLKLVFDHINSHRAVYLFDEFDAIGAKRNKNNDVGEIRRVLNSFLQLFENSRGDSIIISATNHPELLDDALFRRFDKVIEYKNPDLSVVESLMRDRLFSFVKNKVSWKKVAEYAEGMNHAEIVRACNEVAKEIILNDNFFVDEESLKPFFKQ
ncbi:MAG: hypothetical protein CME70_07260 [Halobacteriovorax sp.]|nr:hypothetical protein [Halobacteriovorax sp.]|tara:strand:+ start:389031 stop:389990 length:960 start_codon:yes stop_codon:yes gene_type:complete